MIGSGPLILTSSKLTRQNQTDQISHFDSERMRLDPAKLILVGSLVCYVIALVFLWVTTSATSHGWATETDSHSVPGLTIKVEYGTLQYIISIVPNFPGSPWTCDYSGNSTDSQRSLQERSVTPSVASYVNQELERSTISPCSNIEHMDTTGKFVMAILIFTWICLLPAVALLCFVTFFRRHEGMIKGVYAMGAITLFFSAWPWIIYANKFSQSPAVLSWAFGLSLTATILTLSGLVLSIIGLKKGGAAYDVVGFPNQPEHEASPSELSHPGQEDDSEDHTKVEF